MLPGGSAKMKREPRAQVDDTFADLGVTKSASPDTAAADANLTYTIQVMNAGPDSADSATLNDTIPIGTTFVSLSAPAGWTCTMPAAGGVGAVKCTDDVSLGVSAVQTFTLVVHVGASVAPGTFINNTATLGSATPDPNDENNSATVSNVVGAAGADVGVTQTVGAETVVAGRDVVYQIHVTNAGPAAAVNASLSDMLQGTLTFVSVSAPAGWTCMTPNVGDGGTVNCTKAGFAAGGVADFTLTANVPSDTQDGTTFENAAQVGTDTIDPNDENNNSVTIVNVASCISGASVVTNADVGTGSLRQAILDLCPGGTIAFDSTQVASPITLTSGELLIDKDLTIQGPGANLLTVMRGAAASDFRVFEVNGSGAGPTVNISGLTMFGGKAAGSAPAGQGGAILQVNGTLTISDSVVSNNAADLDGGGIFGGGTLNISRSTVSGNTAGHHGGGIEAQGDTSVSNSTVVNNTAQQEGGGIGTSTSVDIDVNVESSTISGNTAANGGGFYLKAAANKYNFKNTILSGNIANVSGQDAENSGTLTSQGYNLVGSVHTNPGATFTTQPSDQLGTTPGLALDGSNKPLLADNGGTTLTVLPLPSSPALDKGNSFGLTTDQRGFTRPVDLSDSAFPDAAGGDASDVGAVEVNYSFTASAGTPQSTITNVNFATQLQVTLTESGRPVSGVTVTFTAPASGASATFPSGNTAVTDANGRASVTIKANTIAGSYSVTAAAGPLSVSFSLTNLSPGTIQFASSTFQQDENGGTAVINVSRAAGSTGATSVNFSTSNGTATGGASCAAGVDFVNTSGMLSWADGDSSDKTFAVTLCDDALNEPDETINLALSGLTGTGVLGSQTTATLTVRDDDPSGGIVEFAAMVFGVGERDGQRPIFVVRTGDTTRAATVDYATDDGSIPSVAVPCSTTTGAALHRCDYTHTAGTIRFAAGEMSKFFDVPVNDDSYVEGPETTRLVLSNPTGGAALGAQSSSTLRIDDDVMESSGNPVDDDRNFVRQQYHDFLSREPDAAGLDFWTNNINSCGANAQCREVKRVDTSAAFFLSIEFQQTGYFVYLTRKSAFGNLSGAPVPVRLLPFLRDTQEIARGVVVGQGAWQQQLAANRQAFLLSFVGSDEFRTRYPAQTSADAFVNSLDANAGGVLTPNEKEALAGELSPDPSDPVLRADVLRKVAENSTLARAEFNRAFVLMQYFGYLRRDPDAAPDSNFSGYDFWLAKLEQFGGDYRRAEMVKAFINSAEYRQRFGQQQ
jgi:uncharacterized repeat protein (TIGR01451 family)